jgi:SGNH domain (fused to AT3 domains)
LDKDLCLKRDPAKPNYLIIGDSFAADAYVYLSAAYPGVNFLQATAGNCHPLMEFGADEICNTLLRLIFTDVIPNTTLDGVVLSANWQLRDLGPLEKTIDRLRTETSRVVLVGSGIRFPTKVTTLIFQSKRITRVGVENFVNSQIDPFMYTFNDIMRERFRSQTTAYIDVQSIMCEDHCKLFTQDGHMIYVDVGHLTLAGSRYLAPKVASRYGNVFPMSARDGSSKQPELNDQSDRFKAAVPFSTTATYALDTRMSYTGSSCNLESINLGPFGSDRATIAKTSPLILTGWAYDEIRKRPARTLHVVLIDSPGKARYFARVTHSIPRHDVGQYFRLLNRICG